MKCTASGVHTVNSDSPISIIARHLFLASPTLEYVYSLTLPVIVLRSLMIQATELGNSQPATFHSKNSSKDSGIKNLSGHSLYAAQLLG